MDIKGLSIDLKGLKLKKEDRAAFLNAFKTLTESEHFSGTIIEVKYTMGVGSCTAELKRDKVVISNGAVTDKGSIYLAKAQSGDSIHINSTSASGILQITINESTKDATPYTFPAGSNRRKFKVL